jgi:hypothetical protein
VKLEIEWSKEDCCFHVKVEEIDRERRLVVVVTVVVEVKADTE